MKIPLFLCLAWTWTLPLHAAEKGFAAEKKDDRLVITRDGKPLTDFVFKDPQIKRPYFANVKTLAGIQATRTHPPVEGKDPADHADMHPGIWLAFADVSGHDFWRNKASIQHERFTQEPVIKYRDLTFTTLSKMVPSSGAALAELQTSITISGRAEGWMLLWDATITPLVDGFYFGDQEEMGFGVRMASALTEKQGGLITASTGKKSAKETWGQTADWCDYAGKVDGKECGLLLMPSPDNFRKSWFHNRDYGLMAANAFGLQAFTKTAKPDRTTVEKGKSLRLRHGVLVHDQYEFGPDLGIDGAWRTYRSVSSRDEEVARARQIISSLQAGARKGERPRAGTLASWDVGLDTWTNSIPTSTIAEIYSESCRKLKQLYTGEVKTWRWEDEITWPRIETVVEFKDGDGKVHSHLIVRAYNNNDNDYFGFAILKGPYETRPGAKLLPSWELPEGHFWAER